jgi:hypothetical protein
MNDWFTGFISGVGATLLGSSVTMLWDQYKYRRDATDRDKSLLRALSHEFDENSYLVEGNNKILVEELNITDPRSHIITPLSLLKNGFWDLVKSNLSTGLIKHESLLAVARDVALLTESINETIKSRQNFKNASGAMSNFGAIVKIYDEILGSQNEQLTKLLQNAKAELAKILTVQ